MAVSNIVTLLLALSVIAGHVEGQIAIDHVGDVEDRLDGYRIQYHEDTNLLMLFTDQLSCYVADVVRGTTLADKLEDLETRAETERAVINVIEQGHVTPTTLDDVMAKYDDPILRAMCYVTEIYAVDMTSLQ